MQTPLKWKIANCSYKPKRAYNACDKQGLK